MTKLLDEAVAQARDSPEEQQDELATTLFAQMAGDKRYGLTPEQVEEVRRIQDDLRTGKTRLATDEEVGAMWKNFVA
jgi:hypothetical protein